MLNRNDLFVNEPETRSAESFDESSGGRIGSGTTPYGLENITVQQRFGELCETILLARQVFAAVMPRNQSYDGRVTIAVEAVVISEDDILIKEACGEGISYRDFDEWLAHIRPTLTKALKEKPTPFKVVFARNGTVEVQSFVRSSNK